jgi:hypothetical protein
MRRSALRQARARGQYRRAGRHIRGWFARKVYWGWLTPMIDMLDGRPRDERIRLQEGRSRRS